MCFPLLLLLRLCCRSLHFVATAVVRERFLRRRGRLLMSAFRYLKISQFPSLWHSVAFSFCQFCCCGIFCSWNSSTRCISAAPTAYSCEEKQGMLLLQSTGKSVFFSLGFSFFFLLFFAFFLSSSSFESISSICSGRCRFLLFVL